MTDWFDSYRQPDYARTGNVATQTITVAAGPVIMEDSVAPHSIEPQLRKLGMPTKLVKGVPTIDDDFVICSEGETLKPNQVNLLMLFNHLLSTVSVHFIAHVANRLTSFWVCCSSKSHPCSA